MSMLIFMPWCRINKPYAVGNIKIVPFERHAPIDALDDTAQYCVNTIMNIYKDIEGRPIDSAALIRYDDRSFLDDLSIEEMTEVGELITLACFSGLAGREYLNSLGSYCNGDCFTFYFQKLDKPKFTEITMRRREGSTSSLLPIDRLAITIPVHCHTIRDVTIDEILLKALIDYRQSQNEEWAKYQNALSCFNQANTDSDNIRHQVEWVLLCSAFEHILEVKSEKKAKDVASKFSEIIVPSKPLLAQNATRKSDNWQTNGHALRYEWMYEFYRIRGDFAHGKLNTQQPMIWKPIEHLTLAAIAFPLVVKCLLEKAGFYELTDNDRSQIDCFEKFADTLDFLKPPPDQRDSLDFYWHRLVSARISRIVIERAVQKVLEETSTSRC